jgi:mono/diheme cytochrome c family protein
MNRKHHLLIGILLLFTLSFLSACTTASTAVSAENADSHEDDGQDEEHDSMAHAHVDAPHEFEDLTNPVVDDHEALEAGEVIFKTNCVACHGETGMGDGLAAEALDPKPATLADGMMMNMLSDGYLFWRVSKGGMIEPFNSAMPAWEAALTEEQRWQVITYVRSLSDGDGHMEEGEHMEEHMEGDHMEDDHMEDDHSD